MSKYTALIQDLETSEESFSQLAKKHGHKSSIAHAALTKLRPDLLGPRSARLGFVQVSKTDIPDNVRAEALEQVLAGRPVKEVAASTGVPAPTLYQMARKARSAMTTTQSAVKRVQGAANRAEDAQISPVIDILTAQLRAAAEQLGLAPEELCDLIKRRIANS